MVNRGVITSTREGRSLFRLREDVQLINARMLSMMEGKDGTIVCETLNSGTQAKDVGNIKNKGKKTIRSPFVSLHIQLRFD